MSDLGSNLKRFTDTNQKYLVFDCETESLNLYRSRPWQIAWVVGCGGNILETHDYYVKINDFKISEAARRITHFNEFEYKERAIDANIVLDRFNEYLYNPEYTVLGHNVLGFDIYQHNTLMRDCGRATDYSYLSRIIDTHCLAKAIKLGWKFNKKDNLLAWQYRLLHHVQRGLKTSLSALTKEYEISTDETKLHLAEYDIILNYQLWNKMKWQIEI